MEMKPDILTRLQDKIDGKYYGKYRGTVVENDDPDNLGRLRVRVPSVLGPDVVTGWAMPCVPFGGAEDQGFFFVPDVDAGVWIEFEGGNISFPVWVGTYWAMPGGDSEVPEATNAQRPPTSKLIKTQKGHIIEISDSDSDSFIKIIDGSNGNSIVMDSNGTIIEDKSKNRIEMTASAINIFPAVECNLGSRAVNFVNNLPACLFTGAPHALAGGHGKVSK